MKTIINNENNIGTISVIVLSNRFSDSEFSGLDKRVLFRIPSSEPLDGGLMEYDVKYRVDRDNFNPNALISDLYLGGNVFKTVGQSEESLGDISKTLFPYSPLNSTFQNDSRVGYYSSTIIGDQNAYIIDIPEYYNKIDMYDAYVGDWDYILNPQSSFNPDTNKAVQIYLGINEGDDESVPYSYCSLPNEVVSRNSLMILFSNYTSTKKINISLKCWELSKNPARNEKGYIIRNDEFQSNSDNVLISKDYVENGSLSDSRSGTLLGFGKDIMGTKTPIYNEIRNHFGGLWNKEVDYCYGDIIDGVSGGEFVRLSNKNGKNDLTSWVDQSVLLNPNNYTVHFDIYFYSTTESKIVDGKVSKPVLGSFNVRSNVVEIEIENPELTEEGYLLNRERDQSLAYYPKLLSYDPGVDCSIPSPTGQYYYKDWDLTDYNNKTVVTVRKGTSGFWEKLMESGTLVFNAVKYTTKYTIHPITIIRNPQTGNDDMITTSRVSDSSCKFAFTIPFTEDDIEFVNTEVTSTGLVKSLPGNDVKFYIKLGENNYIDTIDSVSLVTLNGTSIESIDEVFSLEKVQGESEYDYILNASVESLNSYFYFVFKPRNLRLTLRGSNSNGIIASSFADSIPFGSFGSSVQHPASVDFALANGYSFDTNVAIIVQCSWYSTNKDASYTFDEIRSLGVGDSLTSQVSFDFSNGYYISSGITLTRKYDNEYNNDYYTISFTNFHFDANITVNVI